MTAIMMAIQPYPTTLRRVEDQRTPSTAKKTVKNGSASTRGARHTLIITSVASTVVSSMSSRTAMPYASAMPVEERKARTMVRQRASRV